ncbi:hypothetical protein J2Y58_003705 [Sphingomonas sp. BE138]|nr:hypothetical protein [Sphingomonas sp. BE138]
MPPIAQSRDTAVSSGSNADGMPGSKASKMMKWVAQAVQPADTMLTGPHRRRVFRPERTAWAARANEA